MIKFTIGFILGVVTATVGFSGIARIADQGIIQIKTTTQEMAK